MVQPSNPSLRKRHREILSVNSKLLNSIFMKKSFTLASIKKDTLAALTVVVYFCAILLFAYIFTMN